jgi:hypothetical protein
VDYAGGPTIDPTQNVKDLSEAANRRQDDLRRADASLVDAKLRHLKEVSDVRETHSAILASVREVHQRELDAAESGRLNSIRQVDREEVAKTAAAAQIAIATLATTTNTMAETLRTQVATVAAAAENRQSAFAGEVNKRLSALELSSSEGKGKQQVSDPQIDRMALIVEKLASNQDRGTGKQEGISVAWAVLLGAVAMVSGMLGIAGVLYAVLKP